MSPLEVRTDVGERIPQGGGGKHGEGDGWAMQSHGQRFTAGSEQHQGKHHQHDHTEADDHASTYPPATGGRTSMSSTCATLASKSAMRSPSARNEQWLRT